MKTIYHHLGLGDHIICNAIVRRHAPCQLVVYEHNLASVKSMFADISLNYIVVPDAWIGKKNFEKKVEALLKGQDVIRLGFDKKTSQSAFDRMFYEHAKVPFMSRWQEFRWGRVPMTPTLPQRICLVHQDEKRGFHVKVPEYKMLPMNVIEMSPDKFPDLADWIPYIQSADEIHCFNSSVALLVDSIVTRARLFYHDYSRKCPEFHKPSFQKFWNKVVAP